MLESEMKAVLDRELPGFTKACDEAISYEKRGYILTLRQPDFEQSYYDMLLIGIAVKYAGLKKVVVYFVNEALPSDPDGNQRLFDILPSHFPQAV